MNYNVVEIFKSIQGEGIHTGKLANFIRLAGCNLNCKWCDTDHEVKKTMRSIDIIQQLDFNCALTVITGGEPTLYDLSYLLNAIKEYVGLNKSKMFIALETNGTSATSEIEGLDWVTVSPKPLNDWQIHKECIPFELKYVVDDELDYTNIQVDKVPLGNCFLQINAKDPANSLQKALEFIERDSRLRLGLQAHTYLNLE
jgi:organic radical activating enzyme